MSLFFSVVDTQQEFHQYKVDDLPDIPVYRYIPDIKIVSDIHNNSLVRIKAEKGSEIKLFRDAASVLTLSLTAAQVPNAVDLSRASRVLLLLYNEAEGEEWTSLHISVLRNTSEVVSLVLDQISTLEHRKRFIEEVESQLCWAHLQWNRDAVDGTAGGPAASSSVSNWTLLHATAKRDAVQVMGFLMEKICSTDSWKILTCYGKDRQAALHIAVAEGDAPTVIMLLDLGTNSQFSSLCSQMADRCTTDISLHSEYLSTTAEFVGPSLHMAALRNDEFLVSWMLQSSNKEKVKLVNDKDRDGFTSLHLASQANNPEIIEKIAQALGMHDFAHSVNELTNNGETALHIAITSNSPAALHAILSSVDKEHRQEILVGNSSAAQNIEEMTKKTKFSTIKEILKCKQYNL